METIRDQGRSLGEPGIERISPSLRLALKSLEGDIASAYPGLVTESGVRWRNLDLRHLQTPGVLTLALELCPLYKPGALSDAGLVDCPTCEEDILESRVGGKWVLTLAAIRGMKGVLEDYGVDLNVRATFADVCVMARDSKEAKSWTSRNVYMHRGLYEELLGRHCEHMGVGLVFQNMSECDRLVNEEHRVPQVINCGGKLGEKTYYPCKVKYGSLAQLASALQLQDVVGDMDVGGRRYNRSLTMLTAAVRACGGNKVICSYLLNTYIRYLGPVTEGADVHLGMERAAYLLSIQTSLKGSPLRSMTAFNVRLW